MSDDKKIFYHVKIRINGRDFYERDLRESTLKTNIIKPYYEGGKILLGGMIMNAPEVERVQIYLTSETSYTIIDNYRRWWKTFKRSSPEPDYSDKWFFEDRAIDVTKNFISSIPDWAMKIDKVDVSAKILERIDPSFDVLESWLNGTGTKAEKDFEKAITILFHLCGLRTVHVGDDYELATQRSRTEKHAKTTISTDVIALTYSKDVYLIQCTKEWSQSALTNILDVQKELKGLLQAYNINLHPVIVSRVLRSKILESIDEADKKNVRVVTMENLIIYLNEIRNGKQPLEQLVSHMKGPN